MEEQQVFTMRHFWTIMILLPVMLVLPATSVRAQLADLAFVETRAEATDFIETTRYDELMNFVDVVVANSDRLFQTTFGYTTEGRALPLVVFGDVRSAAPADVRRVEKTRVFIMANIHGGEVEGKEASLMMLRAMAEGRYDRMLDSLVILVAPIYNADGNEAIALDNRGPQHGPLGGMGTRANARGYNLNRDHTKVDAPETRGLIALLRDYDPHVVVDLHATNGTHHGYHLTYAPPLNPNTSAGIIDLLRGDWLPTMTERIKGQYDIDTYYYGNLPWPGQDLPRGWYTFDYRPRFNNNYVGLRNRPAILSEAYAYLPFRERVDITRIFVDEILQYAQENAQAIRAVAAGYGNLPWPGQDLPRGWYTFDYRPRFNNNYVGLRNRPAILSEAYAYLPFRERVDITRIFVDEILQYAQDNAQAIRAVAIESDVEEIVGTEMALRATFEQSPEPVEILMGDVAEEMHPFTGDIIYRRLDVRRPEEMFEHGAFTPTETERVPEAYLIPGHLVHVLEALSLHGIRYEQIGREDTLEVERFRIDESRTAEREFERHHMREVDGEYERLRMVIPAGWYRVDMHQPLARLAFVLLEPRSDDGLLAWNKLDDEIEGQAYYPLLRVTAEVGHGTSP